MRRRSFSCRALLGLAAGVVASSPAPRARADELLLTLSYSAPSGCPSAEELQGAVRRLATKQTKPYSASVVIESDSPRFTARILSSDGTERSLEGSTCEEVAEATAVVLALAISPSSANETAKEPTPASHTERRATQATPTDVSANGRVRPKLGTAGVLDIGTLPHADLGASVRVGATARAWSAALEGAYWLLPERRLLSPGSKFGGDFSWWSVLAAGCVAPVDAPVRLELCAGPELGHLTGHGVGISFPQDKSTFRLGFEALVEAHLPLSKHLNLRAGIGAAALLLGRRTFELDGLGTVYRPPVMSGRGAFGAEFVF